jgi:C-22 sterol desaturase
VPSGTTLILGDFKMAVNASFVSPTADAKVAHMVASFDANGLVSMLTNNLNGWRLVLTILVLAIAYDQCMSQSRCDVGSC